MAAKYAFNKTPSQHIFLFFAPTAPSRLPAQAIVRTVQRRAAHSAQVPHSHFPVRRAPRGNQPAPPRQRNFSSSVRRRKDDGPDSKPKPDVISELGSPEAPTLSQRMRKLSREYGWSALGVYLGLSALDFPFCFLAVRMLGVERIGRYEKIIVDGAKGLIIAPVQRMLGIEVVGEGEGAETMTAQEVELQRIEESKQNAFKKGEEWSWGVEEAEAAHKSNATIWTQLALAYAIHKSFIFIRVPLTAAVTPKVVKTLRGWGWDIGKRKPKPEIK